MTLILSSLLFLTSLQPSCGTSSRPTPELSSDASAIQTFLTGASQTASDDALAGVKRLDQSSNGPHGEIAQLAPSEHLRRASIYLTNRVFEDARRHWQALIARYPNDPAISATLFAMGRSYFQERKYAQALEVFERLGKRETQSKEGRDGFYYVAPTLLRLGQPLAAATRYREYIELFPQGERLADAHLNVIDSFREGGNYQDAIAWVGRTRERFVGTPTEVNAIFARLRLDVANRDFAHALAISEELQPLASMRGASTNPIEVTYLRAYSLEKLGRKQEAASAFLTIADNASSYYGSLATKHLLSITPGASGASTARMRQAKASQEVKASANQYPIFFREIILRHAKQHVVDPRLILAIMKQESSFNARAKSPAAARGLMQLTFDTAMKYVSQTGLKNLQEDDLYKPEVSIQLACIYLSELALMFPNLPEAVAASYNGGEDNVARWVKRAQQSDPGVFASEVGFAETKDYVFKVMTNYRAYSIIYSQDLVPTTSRPRR